jgi:hypothetical protein
MDIKFCTNTISLGKGKSFNDLVNKIASKDETMVKQASKEEKDEAESSGQPEAEAKLVNQPKVEDEKKESAADETIKEAGEKGMCECGKPNFICKGKCKGESSDSDDDKEDKKEDDDDDKEDKKEDDDDKEASADADVKEASGKNEDECADSSGQLDCEPLHQKGESEKAGDLTGKEKKTEAGTKPKFVKVAKLNSKTRSFLADYYSQYYPADFVEALLAEK